MSEGDSVQTRSRAKASAAEGETTSPSPDPADTSPPPGNGGGGDADTKGAGKSEMKPKPDASKPVKTEDDPGGSGSSADPAARDKTAMFAACQRLRLKLGNVARDVDTLVTRYQNEDLEPTSDSRVLVISLIKTIKRVSSELKTQHEKVLHFVTDPADSSLVNMHCSNVESSFDEGDHAEAVAEELLSYITRQIHAMHEIAVDPSSGSRPATSEPELAVRLPAHELPKFSGHCVDWPVFWNQPVLDQIPEDDRETATVIVAPDEHGVKTLGVGWHMGDDMFVFIVPDALRHHPTLQTPDTPLTRRKLLSSIATVFDPLGWIAPLTVCMKILFQRSWSVTSDWNDNLPADICTAFREWVQNLLKVEFLTIPRRVVVGNLDDNRNYELHLFCDASEQAMATCVYIVSKDATGQHARLLCAKTKLAPRKTLTVPRLELGAMLLGVKLVTACKESMVSMKYVNTRVCAYSDSTVALIWTKSCASKWGIFVANRVIAIQDVVGPDQWFHVPGVDNPADLATREGRPKLDDLPLWWNGPQFLREGTLPVQPLLESNDLMDEQKKTPTVAAAKERESDLWLVDTTSCFGRLLNNATRVLRVRDKFRKRDSTPGVATEALAKIVLQEQEKHYQTELSALRAGRQVPRSSRIARLSPFIHDDGTLRVGGRLQHTRLDYDEKHPFILPRLSPLVPMIFITMHIYTDNETRFSGLKDCGNH